MDFYAIISKEGKYIQISAEISQKQALGSGNLGEIFGALTFGYR